MSSQAHTYGPTCKLAPNVTVSGSKGDNDIPAVRAQFFYSSQLPIDDPLTAIPAPSGESKAVKYAPRPFSAYDNNALEEAWLGLASSADKKHHQKLKGTPLKHMTKAEAARWASIVSDLASKHNKKHAGEVVSKTILVCKSCGHTIDGSMAEKCPKDCSCNRHKSGCAFCSAEPPSGLASGITPESKEGVDADREGPQIGAIENSERPHCEDPQDVILNPTLPICCSELENDVKAEQRRGFSNILRRRNSKADQHQLIQDIMIEVNSLKSTSKSKDNKRDSKKGGKMHEIKEAPSEIQVDTTDEPNSKETSKHTLSHAKAHSATSTGKSKDQANPRAIEKHHKSALESPGGGTGPANLTVPGSADTGTTGFPFQRAPSRKENPRPRSPSPIPKVMSSGEHVATNVLSTGSPSTSRRGEEDSHQSFQSTIEEHSSSYPVGARGSEFNDDETVYVHRCKAQKNNHGHTDVPVGISRLHLVKLPALQMMPIYWSPVHDIAAVTRGTWFYKDSMYPVEPTVANQLENGYRELRPWSQTWSDELSSALEVGSQGEEKITVRLWPKENNQPLATDPKKKKGNNTTALTCPAIDPWCAAKCFDGEVAAEGSIDPYQPDKNASTTAELVKKFPNSHVIYKDAQNAFILKPSLQPSAYFGRRPLAKIKRGITVGIHVIRGYDWKAWEKLHPTKKSMTAVKAEEVAPVTGNADATKRPACFACQRQEERPKVTDLVLIAHGIGQAYAERNESFHFTHAINAFRRSVNVEMGNESVQKVLRDDLGGVMLLPVNWRSNLSFEETGILKSREKPGFSLKDITPDTIPAVRNLISDILLDIPFYMSNHKPRMIKALITEANRVYRLWCRNNPEFHAEGRVHIIAHSLGSAMVMDILSKQPTAVRHIDIQKSRVQTNHFDFDTINLFFAGSPGAFFLWLENGMLLPRKGRNKPGTGYADERKELVGDVGEFGCLAVNNVYNVMQQNDPVTYSLNAAIDPVYASSLKKAHVPSATTGWLESFGNAMRSMTPGTSTTADLAIGELAKPLITRLPSQLEMEVHDFSREEIAEKRLYLLNDNGQIDYYLGSGGGPLEIPYLNMLGAHSSYWTSPDFVRMLVIEVGRKPGKLNTLANMRAVKKSHK